jgi:3-methylcrotonyl-CoA carboxylase alpha subunit
MQKINKILISNRGEIASRIIKTCKRLEIKTVAIFSDVDKNYSFVKDADQAIPLLGSESKETYLNIEKIISIAIETKCNAIHPGYGFLSENSNFAEEVEKAGLIFIGPHHNAIFAMGDKVESRKKMKSINVPVVPGFDGVTTSDTQLLEEAKKIGFPVMVKASAGGGGRGMRKVFSEKDFFTDLESARREAKNFFSNDSVFIEKYIVNPRHIEVQIFGDNKGNVVHLYDRDCSIQRRNQKVIEEAPAPNISDKTRNEIYNTAISAGKCINYTNAGTVEFVMDENENFYFLEMNTRLQVEHPVTEMITGLDLVELQIRISEGYSIYDILPDGKVPEKKGSAIELRICAEEGLLDSKPSSGTIRYLNFSEKDGTRFDSGVVAGNNVSIYYDSMIAKLISYSESRSLTIEKSLNNLKALIVLGIPTNHLLLDKILNHSEFKDGKANTGFLEKNIHPSNTNKELLFYLSICAVIHSIKIHDLTNRAFSEINFEPKTLKKCYISNPFEIKNTLKIKHGNLIYSIYKDNDIFYISQDKEEFTFVLHKISLINENDILFENGERIYFCRYGLNIYLQKESIKETFQILTESNSSKSKNSGIIQSPMPGKIISIHVKKGDTVNEGDPLISIESMKMENIIRAKINAKVEDIFFSANNQINSEETLMILKNI